MSEEHPTAAEGGPNVRAIDAVARRGSSRSGSFTGNIHGMAYCAEHRHHGRSLSWGTVLLAFAGLATIACSSKHDGGAATIAGPTFAGVRAVAPGSVTSLFVTWPAASDTATTPDQIVYHAYVGTSADDVDYAHPAGTSAPGARSLVIPGLRADAKYFVSVRATNAAGGEDTNKVTLGASPSADGQAPTFKGVVDATRDPDGGIALAWSAGSDDQSPPDAIAYQLFASDSPDTFDFAHPTLATAPGDVTGRLPGPWQADRPHFFLVRAVDAAANVDTNLVTIARGFATNDSTPPTFAGLRTGTVDPQARTADLEWDDATDDQTPAGKLVYEIYESVAAAAYDFKAPPKRVTTVTKLTLTDLAGDVALKWIVRARDLGNNEDANSAEQGGTTDVSFVANIQPIFTYNCAVIGCHVPGNPPAGMVLAGGFAYAQIVGVPSAENAPMSRITAGDPPNSFLYLKVLGTAGKGNQMPAPATGNVLTDLDKDRIRRWIVNGALQN
jgi:hypothetical protein